MANGKKKPKKGKKKAEQNDANANCSLPMVCAYLEKVAPPTGVNPPPAGQWFTDVQDCLENLVLAVKRLERNIHFGDTTETGGVWSVFHNPGGGSKTPPPPPSAYP